MNLTSVIGNNSWKFHDDNDGNICQTDGQKDGQMDRQTEPFMELLGRS